MSLIAELRKSGLVKEAPEKKKETTTTGNIAVAVKPLAVVKRTNPVGEPEEDLQQEQFIDTDQEQDMGRVDSDEVASDPVEEKPAQDMGLALECIKESVHKLSEAYESMTGEKLHELYCPQCKPNDQGAAFDQDNRDLASAPDIRTSQDQGMEHPV